MTVGELMELLAQYPQDYQVYDIDGMSICEPRTIAQAGLASGTAQTGPDESEEQGDGLG